MSNENKTRILEALQSLQRAWIINKKVKRDAYHHDVYHGYYSNWTLVDYRFRDKMYFLKEGHIQNAIDLIRMYGLPIKYGKKNGIVYFEYCGAQVSFHDPYNKISCKPFKGVWDERINHKSPFSGLIARLRRRLEDFPCEA